MEKIFFVRDNYLDEVNKILAKGAKVKMISTVANSIAGGGEDSNYKCGDIVAYVVVEMPKP